MKLFDQLTKKAKANRQRIVLPEGAETRNITAADHILADELADSNVRNDRPMGRANGMQVRCVKAK